jgi:hypothetical protein
LIDIGKYYNGEKYNLEDFLKMEQTDCLPATEILASNKFSKKY